MFAQAIGYNSSIIYRFLCCVFTGRSGGNTEEIPAEDRGAREGVAGAETSHTVSHCESDHKVHPL